MKEKDTKQYTENGNNYKFNFEEFYKSFAQMRSKKGKECTVEQLEEEIGSRVNVSSSTVHTWRNGNSAPNSIDTIKDLATVFKIEDYHDLLIEERSVNKMVIDYDLETKRMEALEIIYNSIFDFLQEFRDQEGYLSFERATRDVEVLDEILTGPCAKDKRAMSELKSIALCNADIQYVVDVIDTIITNKVFDLKLMFERTAVPLQGTETYMALKEYLNNDFVKYVYDYLDFWSYKEGYDKRYYEVIEKLQKIISEKVLN